MKTRIPPPIYMLLCAAAMWLLNQHAPLVKWISPPWHNIGLLFIVLAVINESLALLGFIRQRTTVNPMSPNNASSLVVSGVYRYSRNPMYVGLATILTGWAIYLGSLSPFIVIPLFIGVITEMQIKPEEHVLEQKFGDSYRQYKTQVRRWL